MENMFDMICDKNIVNWYEGGIYKHILNIPNNICREEILGENLNFKIIILTEDVNDTKENIMQGIMNSSDFYIRDIYPTKLRDKTIIKLNSYKNHGDNVDIEIRNIKGCVAAIRGDWCNLIIFDIEDYYDIDKYLNEELYCRLSVVNKHIYSQMAHNILLYSAK